MKIRLKYALRGIALLAGVALAAGVFIPNGQPFGFMAPTAISSRSFADGNAVAYTPWFENGTYKGDLIAYPLDTSGTPFLLSPLWHAAVELDSQNFLTGRRIVTTDGAGTALPFLWDSLPASYQASLGSVEMVNFIRGDRSNEGVAPTPRTRTSAMGDIIHANPVYVGKPIAGYADTTYLDYV
ncbi:MAG: hypothetical protein ACE5G3_07690, partial [Gammaproteobacteria bacterium]